MLRYFALRVGRALLTIVLVQDVLGKRPDQMFYCSRLDWDARTILSCYSRRWAIEVTFCNCKQLLGLEDPANRVPLAVSRTAPMARLLPVRKPRLQINPRPS